MKKNQTCAIGIIGGTGLYQIPEFAEGEKITMDTPFGSPSDTITVAEINQRRVAFIPRHGAHHNLLPSEIPFRSNIYALKKLGARWIISASAVGSLKEKLKPSHFVIPLQFFDRTKNREEHTFFGSGIVAHVAFGQPICEKLATILYQSATTMGAEAHWGGTYVNMEGPAFSTLAESNFHRQLDFDVIGMTNLAEAKLAREAEISYATLAMVTDYDCWHPEEESVTVDSVATILKKNAALGSQTILHAISQIPLDSETASHHALAQAILTPKEYWAKETAEDLKPILEKYL
ncbi:MAG: S-methyl-5'-thioadenosine phosphorylase [Verrucomicrobiota bacterium]